jgi:CRP-like cAMP-binding protein
MILRDIDLIKGMSNQTVEALIQEATVEEFQRGDVVFREGDIAEHFYVLEEGAVELRVASVDKTPFVAHDSGQVIGWSSLVGRPAYTATVHCILPTRLIKIASDRARRILEENPADGLLFYRQLSAVLGSRLLFCYQELARGGA